MITLKLTKEEFETLHEAVNDYLNESISRIEAFNGYPQKQNYWMNESCLAEKLLKKIEKVDT